MNEESQVAPPSQPVTENSIPAKSNSNFLLIGLIAVVAGIIGSGATYLALQSKTEKQPQPTPVVQASPTPDPVANPDLIGANWKTYTNTDYSYELKYPSTWKVEIPSNTSGVGKPSVYVSLVSDTQFKFDSGCCFPYSLSIKIYENTQNKSIKEVGSGLSNNFTYSEESISGSGMNAFETNSLSSQFGSKTVFLKANNKDYVSLTLSPFSNEKPFPNQESQHKIFNQILSTFKFTDQISKQTNPSVKRLIYFLPSGWKTTQDKTGTLEIGYNPNLSTPYSSNSDLFIDIFQIPLQGQRIIASVRPYDGGSRHAFLYQRYGVTNLTSQDKSDSYHEQEYTYNGWSCLVLYGVYISQIPGSQGMCVISPSRALSIFADANEKDMEQIIQTIRLLKSL